MTHHERRVVVWRVTQDCNLDCQFCSYSRSLDRLRQNADPVRVERFGRLLGAHSKRTGRKTLVSWIGGEPLLWLPLLDTARKFVREFGLEVSITTNGTPLRSRSIVERIVDDFSEIVISIDGFSDVNDWARRRPGLFEELKQNICSLADLKAARGKAVTLKVNTILMRNNIEHFEALCGLLLSWGVEELTFNQLGGYDRPEFFPDNRLLPSQVSSFMKAIPLWKKAFAERGLLIHGNSAYMHRFECSSRDQKISIDDCEPGSWFWFVNENGLISPCSYTSYEYAIEIDSIRSPEDIDAVEASFRQKRSESRSRFCNDCHCTQLFDKFS